MQHGLNKKRLPRPPASAAPRVGAQGGLNVGQRNALAARRVLWQNGVFVHGEALGGTDAADGELLGRGRPTVR